MQQDRYELILDPTDHWTVWDNLTGVPAVFADQLLAGFTEAEAEAALRVLIAVGRKPRPQPRMRRSRRMAKALSY
ncbi:MULTISPECIES: hypothetical protein [Sinorhizobium]|uniref:hypothetical protein n=1 Tax=Sinorhizobium TaxID=28105 RepID=UPI0004B3CEA7|nr:MULTISPECIES: hypothetical protein [Sinorhizobium]